jgi:hypothetical protein
VPIFKSDTILKIMTMAPGSGRPLARDPCRAAGWHARGFVELRCRSSPGSPRVGCGSVGT